VRTAADAAMVRGSVVIDLPVYDRAYGGDDVVPGPAPDTFAFAKATSHRNLFRIQLP